VIGLVLASCFYYLVRTWKEVELPNRRANLLDDGVTRLGKKVTRKGLSKDYYKGKVKNFGKKQNSKNRINSNKKLGKNNEEKKTDRQALNKSLDEREEAEAKKKNLFEKKLRKNLEVQGCPKFASISLSNSDNKHCLPVEMVFSPESGSKFAKLEKEKKEEFVKSMAIRKTPTFTHKE
jgi:hypothetical protein